MYGYQSIYSKSLKDKSSQSTVCPNNPNELKRIAAVTAVHCSHSKVTISLLSGTSGSSMLRFKYVFIYVWYPDNFKSTAFHCLAPFLLLLSKMILATLMQDMWSREVVRSTQVILLVCILQYHRQTPLTLKRTPQMFLPFPRVKVNQFEYVDSKTPFTVLSHPPTHSLLLSSSQFPIIFFFIVPSLFLSYSSIALSTTFFKKLFKSEVLSPSQAIEPAILSEMVLVRSLVNDTSNGKYTVQQSTLKASAILKKGEINRSK